MIPFRDNIPSRTFPLINICIIVTNVLVFFYELSLGSRGLDRLIAHYGIIPAAVLAWPRSDVALSAVAVPFFTSMFLHGGWLHLIGNMWYLWIFGDNVEDRLGHFTFLIFYLLCGLGAGIVHTVLNYNTRVPSIGASGAIAGVLGAYVMSYPNARVLTLIPIFVFVQIIEIPALIVLGVVVGVYLRGEMQTALARRRGVSAARVWFQVQEALGLLRKELAGTEAAA